MERAQEYTGHQRMGLQMLPEEERGAKAKAASVKDNGGQAVCLAWRSSICGA